MMKKTLLALALLFVTVSCGSDENYSTIKNDPANFETSENHVFKVKVEWLNVLTSGSANHNAANLTFVDQNGYEPTTLSLTGFHPQMPKHGHGTYEDDQKFVAKNKGTIKVSGVVFIMGGPANSWVVDIEATVNGKKDKIRVSIPHEVI